MLTRTKFVENPSCTKQEETENSQHLPTLIVIAKKKMFNYMEKKPMNLANGFRLSKRLN